MDSRRSIVEGDLRRKAALVVALLTGCAGAAEPERPGPQGPGAPSADDPNAPPPEAGASPVFRKPVSNGAVFDARPGACLHVDVLVDDADSRQVELTVEMDLEEASFDVSEDGMRGELVWCPTGSIVRPHRQVRFVADDGASPVTHRDFDIIVQSSSTEDCAGDVPIITTDEPVVDGQDVLIQSVVQTSVELADPPVLLVTTDPPDNLADLSAFEPSVMVSIAPSRWAATIDAPPAGQSLHYIIMATSVDAQGCLSTTADPLEGTYRLDGEDTPQCPQGSCEPVDSACCEVQAGPGCGDAPVQDCVCAIDPYCCETHWDDVCVEEVTTQDCGSCPVDPTDPEPTEPQCCEAVQTPGCIDPAIEACVCEVDSYCCEQMWDAFCVEQVQTEGCGTC